MLDACAPVNVLQWGVVFLSMFCGSAVESCRPVINNVNAQMCQAAESSPQSTLSTTTADCAHAAADLHKKASHRTGHSVQIFPFSTNDSGYTVLYKNVLKTSMQFSARQTPIESAAPSHSVHSVKLVVDKRDFGQADLHHPSAFIKLYNSSEYKCIFGTLYNI